MWKRHIEKEMNGVGGGIGWGLESSETTSQFRMLGEDIMKWCRHWVVYRGRWQE